MTVPKWRPRPTRTSIVAATLGAIAASLATAGLQQDAVASATAAGNVKRVKAVFHVANGVTSNAIAKCPGGSRVIGGGFASTGQHARIIAAGPAWVENGYIGYAFTPPVSIATGVGKEIARITLVAFCAPKGKPVVFD